MASDLSQEILKQLQKLSPGEQLDVLVDLRTRFDKQAPVHASRSILEIEGLGAEIWGSIDAQEYVRRERESWNG